MYWWEEEKLLTQKDRDAIAKAKTQDFGEIDENSAETDIGRKQLRRIALKKYHYEEFFAGLD